MLKSVAGRQVPFTVKRFPSLPIRSRRVGLRTMGSIGAKISPPPICPCDKVDGFETGAKAAFWTLIGNEPYAIVTSPIHCGSYAAQTTGTSPGVWKYALTASLVKWFKFFFRIVPNPDNPPTGVGSGTLLRVELGITEVDLYVMTGGAVSPRFRLGAPLEAYVDGVTALEVNRWYCVKLRCEGNKAGAVHKLYLDGVFEIQITHDTEGYDFSEFILENIQWTLGRDCRTAIDCYCQMDSDTDPSCDDSAHPECYT